MTGPNGPNLTHFLHHPPTQREAAVELQVGGEEAGQAAEQLAAGLASVQLVAAVHQAVGRGAIVGLVQDAHQQLAFTDQHLGERHRKDETVAPWSRLGGAVGAGAAAADGCLGESSR